MSEQKTIKTLAELGGIPEADDIDYVKPEAIEDMALTVEEYNFRKSNYDNDSYVIVRFRDEADGGKIKGVSFGSGQIVDTFKNVAIRSIICPFVVTFKQVENKAGTHKYWVVE